MKKGKFFDVGTHQDLIDKHKSYSKILSIKEGENEPVDLDSAPGPFGTDGKQGTKKKDKSLQNKIEFVDDRDKSASLRASLSELGAVSAEAISSTSSLHKSVASLLDEYDEKEYGTGETISVVGFSEGIDYFIKVRR